MMNHRRHPSAHNDAGIALVVAISLMGLVSVLMLTMVAYALRETGSSGRDRQRSSAISAAEGQVDLTLARIQRAGPAALPCGPQAAVTSQQSAADSMSVQTTVTYYNAANAVVACPITTTAAVVAAKVASTAVSPQLAGQAPARRTMETLIRLTAEYDNGLNKAIFGESGVFLKNNSEISGTGPPNADVYTNGNFSCENNQRYHGSIYAQGRIDLLGRCTVDVNVHAGTGFKASNAAISGEVLVRNGIAELDGNASVGGVVRARGSITWPGKCTPTPRKCFPGVTDVPPVPAQVFPPFNYDAAAWSAAGYTNVVTANTCGTGPGSPGRWLRDNAASTSRGKTILLTNCQLTIQNNVNTIALADDLAVFARGGIEFSNSVTIRSTVSDNKRRLYLVQPYDSVSTHPCTSTGIAFRNQVTVESSVDYLLYTPCSVSLDNNSTHFGQIYGGGTVNVNNHLTMTYRPLPVYGVVAPTTTRSYALDTVYKRETR